MILVMLEAADCQRRLNRRQSTQHEQAGNCNDPAKRKFRQYDTNGKQPVRVLLPSFDPFQRICTVLALVGVL